MNQNKSELKTLFTRGISFLLIATFLCISILAFAGMNKTVAWFAKKDEVSSDGMLVMIKGVEGVESNVMSYAVSEIVDTDVNDKRDNRYTLSTAGVYELPTYDPNNISYSIYQKALVVVIQIKSANAATFDVFLDTPNDTIIDSENNVFSNCMQIMRATLDNTSTYATPTDTVPMSFVSSSREKDTRIALGTVSLTPNASATLYSATVCYVIEYYDGLGEIFKPSLDMIRINFANDIQFTVTPHNN